MSIYDVLDHPVFPHMISQTTTKTLAHLCIRGSVMQTDVLVQQEAAAKRPLAFRAKPAE